MAVIVAVTLFAATRQMMNSRFNAASGDTNARFTALSNGMNARFEECNERYLQLVEQNRQLITELSQLSQRLARLGGCSGCPTKPTAIATANPDGP